MNEIVHSERLGSQVAMTNSAGGFAVTPQSLSDIVEFAKFMCQSNFSVPAFLRNNGPDCAAVIMQAMKWGFDPFSVAQKSYKVKDIIAYEAQLIAAVINARSGIKGRLRYQFDGEGDNLTCTVTGSLDGEDCSYTSPRVGNITTKNSPLWKTDPQQQLGYYSARNWARRHCPEVILGAYDRDEAEEFRGPDNAKDVTPSVMQRLQAQQQPQDTAQPREGFDVDFVARETALLTGETNHEQSDVPASGFGSGEIPQENPAPAADQTAGNGEAEEGATEAAHGEQAASSSDLTQEDRDWLLKAAKMLVPCALPGGEAETVRNQYAGLIKYETPATISQLAIAKAVSICKRLVAVCDQTEELDMDLIAGIAGVEPREIV